MADSDNPNVHCENSDYANSSCEIIDNNMDPLSTFNYNKKFESVKDDILSKDKQDTSKLIEEECLKNPDRNLITIPSENESLGVIMHYVLSPHVTFISSEMVDWIRWLVAGGKQPKEFVKEVEEYTNAKTCESVWSENVVFYRCRTCSVSPCMVSPCMSLCPPCFKDGNHEGHSFAKFRSQAGGACDCGNIRVMNRDGFCPNHWNNGKNPTIPPMKLTISAEVILPKLFHRFLIMCRKMSDLNSSEIIDGFKQAQSFFDYVDELMDMGAIMRTIIKNILLNKKLYQDTLHPPKNYEFYDELRNCINLYMNSKNSMPNCDIPMGFEDKKGLSEELIHETFLDEIVYWMVRYKFPEKVVCFLLNMRPDHEYEKEFCISFVRHYSRATKSISSSGVEDKLCISIVHISVQLFSHRDLAYKMATEHELLYILVLSLKGMISSCIKQSGLSEPNSNHLMINCKSEIMKNHSYWPMVSDFNNVLSSKRTAEIYIRDGRLISQWHSVVAMFQGMNMNKRELRDHVEFEPKLLESFSVESEACATPTWIIVAHMADPELKKQAISITENCLKHILVWFEAIGFSRAVNERDENLLSFHIPLHRIYAINLWNLIKYQKVKKEEILPPDLVFESLLIHPLRVQAGYYEILCGKWVRNGFQMKLQANIYTKCHFSNSMADADIFFLQLGAMTLNPDKLIDDIIRMFNMDEFLYLSEGLARFIVHRPMIQSFFIFIATLVTSRTYIDNNDENIYYREMASLLSMQNKPHSSLVLGMPSKASSDAHFVNYMPYLEDLANYHKPYIEAANGHVYQGTYHPKPKVWDSLYDPLHVMLRSVNPKDYQSSFDRFKAYCRTTGKAEERTHLWPPYRLPVEPLTGFSDPRRLISCSTTQAMLIIFLFKMYNQKDISEHILSLVIFLLELIVDYQSKPEFTATTKTQFEDKYTKIVFDGCPEKWFLSDDIFVNATIVVQRVGKASWVPKGNSDEGGSDGSSRRHISDTSITSSGDGFLYHPVATGSELAPYDENGKALILTDGYKKFEQRESSPNVEHPESELVFRAINGEPMSSDDEENVHMLERTNYPALLSGTEISKLPENGDVSSSSSVLHLPDDDIDMSVSEKLDNSAMTTIVSGESSMDDTSSKINSDVSMSIFLEDDCIGIYSSLISLLLKLHTRLSGRAGSYKPNFTSTEDSRIGNGAFFVAKLLDKLGRHNKKTAENILYLRKMFYFPGGVIEEEVDQAAKQEYVKRKTKAAHRRSNIMNHFSQMQGKFMKKNEFDYDVDSDAVEETEILEYYCSICGQTTPSTWENPVGLLAFAQSTSILAYKNSTDITPTLPDTYSDLSPSGDILLGKYMDKKATTLHHYFGKSSLLAMNCGWEGGVHLQSCGHYLHIECQQRYVHTLRSQSRTIYVKPDMGDFMCPLCRQLANCVVPVGSELADSNESNPLVAVYTDKVLEIDQLLRTLTVPTYSDIVTCSMARLMENLTKATYKKYRAKSTDSATCTLFMFVSSIARTNLELALMQRGGNLVNNKPSPEKTARSSYIAPLLYTLAFHSKILGGGHFTMGDEPSGSIIWIRQLWSSITLKKPEGCERALSSPGLHVPMLFRDPITLLLQMILMLPLKLDPPLLDCIMLNIYKLVVIRATVGQLCQLNETQRKQLLTETHLSPVFSMVYAYLKDSPILKNDVLKNCDFSCPQQSVNGVGQNCLEFLRIAALLKSYITRRKIPVTLEKAQECIALEKFIRVYDSCSIVNPAAIVNMCGVSTSVVGFNGSPRPGILNDQCMNWCSEAVLFSIRSLINSHDLLIQKRFFSCHLLKFPSTYDDLFQKYYSKMSTTPKEPGICLVCGATISLRDTATSNDDCIEAVQHSIDCGAGTCIFLAVKQSHIYVIRGKRFICWGSLYLDDYGEEDKDLKRGKPLFLNKERADLLEDMWINFRFETVDRKWLSNRELFGAR